MDLGVFQIDIWVNYTIGISTNSEGTVLLQQRERIFLFSRDVRDWTLSVGFAVLPSDSGLGASVRPRESSF